MLYIILSGKYTNV